MATKKEARLNTFEEATKEAQKRANETKVNQSVVKITYGFIENTQEEALFFDVIRSDIVEKFAEESEYKTDIYLTPFVPE